MICDDNKGQLHRRPIYKFNIEVSRVFVSSPHSAICHFRINCGKGCHTMTRRLIFTRPACGYREVAANWICHRVQVCRVMDVVSKHLARMLTSACSIQSINSLACLDKICRLYGDKVYSRAAREHEAMNGERDQLGSLQGCSLSASSGLKDV